MPQTLPLRPAAVFRHDRPFLAQTCLNLILTNLHLVPEAAMLTSLKMPLPLMSAWTRHDRLSFSGSECQE